MLSQQTQAADFPLLSSSLMDEVADPLELVDVQASRIDLTATQPINMSRGPVCRKQNREGLRVQIKCK